MISQIFNLTRLKNFIYLKNAKVIAVDQSEEILNVLKDKFSYYKDFKCIQRVGESIPIEDNSVDYVFANMFLHHVENLIHSNKGNGTNLKIGKDL
jgi:ubiquinone/menaquinone biosynthesis C-methylase UbiE